MKFFGKLAATLLSLSFCFSAFGCADLTNSDLGNSGSNGGSSGGGEQEQTQIGETLANAIMGQLEEANTVTFSLEWNLYQQDSFKNEEMQENDYYQFETVTLNTTLAKTESGYDIMTTNVSTIEESYGKNGELDKYENTSSNYTINGIAYNYEEMYGGYTYSPYGNSQTEFPDLSSIADSFKAEEVEAFKNMLGEALTEVYNVTEGNIAFAYDGKDAMNALLDYVAAIDPDTKTLESVLNDALALVDEELTVTAILAEIEKLDTVTVGDAVAAIDAYLTENADTTLQGLKDQLIADERIVVLFQEQGMTEEDIAEIEATVLADVIEPYKDMLLDEIVYDMVISSSSEEGETPTHEQFILSLEEELAAEFPNDNVDSVISYVIAAMAKPTLAMTIAQIAGEDGINTVNGIIGTCADVTVNAFNAGMNVEFDKYFQIETMSANGNIEIVADNENLTSTQKASFSFSVDSISKDVTEITLPEDAKLVFAFWENDVRLENNSGVGLMYPDYDAETDEYSNLVGHFYLNSGNITVDFTYEVPTEVTNTWDITITDITIDEDNYSGDELVTLLNGNLTYTLTFDFDDTGDYITDFAIPGIETL